MIWVLCCGADEDELDTMLRGCWFVGVAVAFLTPTASSAVVGVVNDRYSFLMSEVDFGAVVLVANLLQHVVWCRWSRRLW